MAHSQQLPESRGEIQEPMSLITRLPELAIGNFPKQKTAKTYSWSRQMQAWLDHTNPPPPTQLHPHTSPHRQAETRQALDTLHLLAPQPSKPFSFQDPDLPPPDVPSRYLSYHTQDHSAKPTLCGLAWLLALLWQHKMTSWDLVLVTHLWVRSRCPYTHFSLASMVLLLASQDIFPTFCGEHFSTVTHPFRGWGG